MVFHLVTHTHTHKVAIRVSGYPFSESHKNDSMQPLVEGGSFTGCSAIPHLVEGIQGSLGTVRNQVLHVARWPGVQRRNSGFELLSATSSTLCTTRNAFKERLSKNLCFYHLCDSLRHTFSMTAIRKSVRYKHCGHELGMHCTWLQHRKYSFIQ